MSGFPCECFMCATQFTAELPTVFCSDGCRAEAFKRHEAAMAEYYARPDAIWPGDTVRRLTDEDRVFRQDVKADVAALP